MFLPSSDGTRDTLLHCPFPWHSCHRASKPSHNLHAETNTFMLTSFPVNATVSLHGFSGWGLKSQSVEALHSPFASINFWRLLASVPWHLLTIFFFSLSEAVLLESWLERSGVDNHLCPDLPASVPELTEDLNCWSSECRA